MKITKKQLKNIIKEELMKEEASQRLSVGGWDVYLIEDEDGHLTIQAGHEDGTLVQDVGEDLGSGNSWGVRLTTEGIEDEYNRSA